MTGIRRGAPVRPIAAAAGVESSSSAIAIWDVSYTSFDNNNSINRTGLILLLQDGWCLVSSCAANMQTFVQSALTCAACFWRQIVDSTATDRISRLNSLRRLCSTDWTIVMQY